VALPGTDPAPVAAGPGEGAAPHLLCVGSVTPRKGQDLLAGALARVRDLSWTCTCVGSLDRDADFAAQVTARIADEGLGDRVRMVGEVDDATLADLFHHSSLFVLPSWYEGYGMALSEALARGLPVVSTSGGAIPETVPDEAGLLVPPGDEGAFAAALRKLLQPEQRQQFARSARRHAATLPDWDAAAAVLAAAIEQLAEAARADPSSVGPGGGDGR
jgi:glycosyltransferase involved in cell wall biosynthesis